MKTGKYKRTQYHIEINRKVHLGLVSWRKGKKYPHLQRENSAEWKGKKATYSAFHKRIYRIKGLPNFCEVCKTTKAKRFEWANLTGKYHDINDYKRMCSSCHIRYDKKRRSK